MNNTYDGEIKLITGPMFSGKTSELIRRYKRYKLNSKNNCLLIKYKGDTRYSENEIITHDHIKIKSFKCELLEEFDQIINKYNIICIDEIQFFKDAVTYCEKWANQGKKIECCGINGDFERKPFPVITNLIPLVTDITYLSAVCKKNGNDAHYSFRLNANKNVKLIGGEKEYTPVDRKTYFNKS
jgi:thymidine kinase